MSAALYFFSGCSFAQPSGLAPLSLCPKSRIAKGSLLLLPRRYTLIAATFRFIPTLNSRIYGGCSIAATPPLRSSSTNKVLCPEKGVPLYLFLAVLGGV